jgi:ABC-2 type transport system permease protein
MSSSAAPGTASGATIQLTQGIDVSATTAVTSEARSARHAQTASTSAGSLFLPAFTLFQREIVRFYRMRSRVVGVILSPVLFWFVIGSGFGSSFHGPSGGHYLDYFYPGALIMIVLFTSIFTMMSVIEDRREGFLLSVLVSPASRSAIVLGKVLGGAALAMIQGLIFLVFAPLIGVRISVTEALGSAAAVFLVAFALTALGFIIAWRLDSTQAFHAIVNLFLIPLWLISGALFPLSGASGWLRAIMLVNPLTYGVEALRVELFAHGAATATGLSVGDALLVLLGVAGLMFIGALVVASRRRTLPV